MNARLIKETRDLLPIFACTLPLIVVPQLIWPATGVGIFALGVACVVMAGSSFGNEFQHRTLSLLLSQPIPRSVLWRDKMLVLGAGMLTSLAALLVCLLVRWPVSDQGGWLAFVLVLLCAFCGTPFWTLVLRQGIGGMVAAVGAPCGILAGYALVARQLGEPEPAALVTAIHSLLLIYCVLVYWLGYAAFKRLEAVDTPSRELRLPAGLEAFFVRPLTRISSRFRGPFATLLKKEFRVQQINFLLAGLFVLVAVAGFCLIKRLPEVASGIVGGDMVIYMMILPLIAGTISVGEERGWGLAEWHLTLPPSALRQWSAKMLATLSTSLVLGLLLPAAVFLGVDPLFSHPGARTTLPNAYVIGIWVLSQLLVTSVAVYAASFSRNTLRAILRAFVIIAASGVVIWLATYAIHEIGPVPLHWMGQRHVVAKLVVLLLPVALGVVLCLIQWFACLNFRLYERPALHLVVQFTAILLFVWLTAWVFLSALVFLHNS